LMPWFVVAFVWTILGAAFADAMAQNVCKGAEFSLVDRVALAVYMPVFAGARIAVWVADPQASTEPLRCKKVAE
jgi:hypothetical protein